MKNVLAFFFLLMIVCLCVGLSSARADSVGRTQHASTGRMLEFSLTCLKESVQKTLQKNERLSFENDILRKSIRELQQTKEELANKKAELIGLGRASHRHQEYLPLTEAMNVNDRKERTQELINIFQRDIRRLKEQNAMLDDSLSEKGFAEYNQMLLKKREASKKERIDAQKRLKVLQKRNQKPYEKIEELKSEQGILVRQLQTLQSGYGTF